MAEVKALALLPVAGGAVVVAVDGEAADVDAEPWDVLLGAACAVVTADGSSAGADASATAAAAAAEVKSADGIEASWLLSLEVLLPLALNALSLVRRRKRCLRA